jgi:hypothetical protein
VKLSKRFPNLHIHSSFSFNLFSIMCEASITQITSDHTKKK